jgi:Predicted transcriptional regulators
MQIIIEQIKIPARVRKEIGNLEPLMESLSRCGQLNPITVTREFELIAGFRRLSAAKRLNWKMIDAAVVDGLTEERRLTMELEENMYRKDFTPEELLEGWKKLDALRHPKFGARVKTAFKNIFSKLAFWRRPKAHVADAAANASANGGETKRLAEGRRGGGSNTTGAAPADDSEQYGV